MSEQELRVEAWHETRESDRSSRAVERKGLSKRAVTWLGAATAAVALVVAGTYIHGRDAEPTPSAAAAPEETRDTIKRSTYNAFLAEATMQERLLLKDSPASAVFWGRVVITMDGLPDQKIQNPIIFNDAEVLGPGKSTKVGREGQGFDNKFFGVFVTMNAGGEFRPFPITTDTHGIHFQFYGDDGLPVDLPEDLWLGEGRQSEFMTHVVYSDVVLREQPHPDNSDRVLRTMNLPDGTEVSRDIYQG